MSQENDIISYMGKDLVNMNRIELLKVINDLAHREIRERADHSRQLEKLAEFRH